MDRKLPQNQEIERLIRQSAASRSCLANEMIAVQQRFNFPARIRGSLKSHPSAWLLGSLVSGFIASLFTRRKAVVTANKHRGLLATLLGLALTAARPFAKVWLTDQLQSHLLKRPGVIPVHPSWSQPRSTNPI